jgi:cytochrome b6-f complex iron-sulfur subunit
MVAMRRRRRPSTDRVIDALVKGDGLPQEPLDNPDDAEALRAAIALRGARPGADLPRESFLSDLREQLRDVERPSTGSKPGRVSRRNLLAGAGVAAASVAAGVAGAVIDREALRPGSSHHGQVAVQPEQGHWLAVATESELAGGGAKGFVSPGVRGFVSEGAGGELIAVSGVCTHLGCLLQANGEAGRLDCPCHRTAFGLKGEVLFSQLASRPDPLPRLQARRRDGAVEVFVPRLI